MQNSNTELPFIEVKVKKRAKPSSPAKMSNENLKFKIFRYEKETPKRCAQIYQKREGEDSPRSFGIERTRETNSRTLSKNSPHQKLCFGAGLVQHRALLWCWVKTI